MFVRLLLWVWIVWFLDNLELLVVGSKHWCFETMAGHRTKKFLYFLHVQTEKLLSCFCFVGSYVLVFALLVPLGNVSYCFVLWYSWSPFSESRRTKTDRCLIIGKFNGYFFFRARIILILWSNYFSFRLIGIIFLHPYYHMTVWGVLWIMVISWCLSLRFEAEP